MVAPGACSPRLRARPHPRPTHALRHTPITTLGTAIINATYAGDPNNLGSSATTAETINPAIVRIFGPAKADVGQAVTLNATPGFASYQWYSGAPGTATPTATDAVGDCSSPSVGFFGGNIYGDYFASNVIASKSGLLDTIGVNLIAGGGGDMLVAIYQDSDGYPSMPFGYSAWTPTQAGWNDIPIPQSVYVTAGTKYWLAVLFLDTSVMCVKQTPSSPNGNGYGIGGWNWAVPWWLGIDSGETANMRMSYSTSGGTPGTGTAISGATNDIYVAPTGTTGTFLYYVVATDQLGVKKTSDTMSITISGAPAVSVTPSATVDVGGSATLAATVVDAGSGSDSYLWTVPQGLTAGTDCASASLGTCTVTGANQSAAPYSVTVQMEDSTLQSVTATSAVTVNQAANTTAVNPTNTITINPTNTISVNQTTNTTAVNPAPATNATTGGSGNTVSTAGGGVGSPLPTVTVYSSGNQTGYALANLTVGNSETLSFNNNTKTMLVTINVITPTGVGITVSNSTTSQGYNLTPDSPVAIIDPDNYTYYAELTSLSYPSASNTVSLLVYGELNAQPILNATAVAQTNSTSNSSASNSSATVMNVTAQRPPATTTLATATAIQNAALTLGAGANRVLWLVLAIVIIAMLVFLFILFLLAGRRRKKKIANFKAASSAGVTADGKNEFPPE